MSAAEFKTYLKSKGRPDPRVAQVDMRQKFQMFQDMWSHTVALLFLLFFYVYIYILWF